MAEVLLTLFHMPVIINLILVLSLDFVHRDLYLQNITLIVAGGSQGFLERL